MDDIRRKLYGAFSPLVNRTLGNLAVSTLVGRTRIEVGHADGMVDMYHFVVPIRGSNITAYDLAKMAEKLDTFATYEEADGTVTIDGVEYVIGDGDDSGAVELDLAHGEFRIWVRHFKTEFTD